MAQGRTIQLALILGGRLNPTLMNAFNRATQMGNRLGQSVNRSMRSAGTGANGFASNIRTSTMNVIGMNQALELGVKIISGLGKVTGIVDNYSNITARVKMINDGLQSNKKLQDMIYQSAQRSRGAYGDMASSVAKLNLLAKDNFKDNKEALYFTELVQKSFTVGGASTQEKQAGMYQLTQAMAAGKLQGDEFRSIMENAPLIADAISKYLNIPKGVLKELSSEGLITADIIKNSMYLASKDIEGKFKTMPITFADVMTKLENTATMKFAPVMDKIIILLNGPGAEVFIGKLVELIDISVEVAQFALPLIVDALRFVKDNGDILIPVLSGIVSGLAILKVAAIAGSVISVLAPIFSSITFAIMAVVGGAATFGEAMLFVMGPIGWVVLAIGLLVAAGVYLYKNWDTVSVYLQNAWIMMKKAFFTVVNSIIEGVNWIIEKYNMIPGINIPIIAKVEYHEDYNSLSGKAQEISPPYAQTKNNQSPLISALPKYALGGTITTPRIALVGDAPETIVPHTNTPCSRALLANAATGVGMGLNGGNVFINVHVNGSTDNPTKLGYDIADAIENAMASKRRLSYG